MLKILPGWELDVDRGPGWLIVRINRPSEPPVEPPPLAEVLWSLMEQHFTYRVVLELDAIRNLDDYLLDQFLDLQDRVVGHQGLVRICGLSPASCRLLRRRQVEDRIHPYRDREEALGGCNPRLPR